MFDRDIARAADILGFSAREADRLRTLGPGEFFAFGPALAATPVLAKIDPTITTHLGRTPALRAAADIAGDEVHRLLDLDTLAEAPAPRDTTLTLRGTRALDAFLLDDAAPIAAAICGALRRIAPNATTASELARHLAVDRHAVDAALDILAALAAVDTMPRGEDRMARLHARLRARVSDVPVVGLS